ncbi:MAG: 50S ribosomal protein L3 [Candidatus Uhrbacteria bacterium]|nr:50S ribosomal protein L3 [Candidatus Uhrbacteria bacterium]
MKVLLGKKIAMTQAFREDGTVVPVTLIEATPSVVVGVREDASGHAIVVLGRGKSKNANKPQVDEAGDLGAFETMRQFRLPEGETFERGTTFSVDTFKLGDMVNIIGTSKGRGFQGVVKRHGFAGHPATHGHKDQLRKSGSIGAGGVQRVFKGMRMAGRMGGDRVTVKNLEVISIDLEKNIIGLKGAIPGARGGLVTILATEGNVWLK